MSLQITLKSTLIGLTQLVILALAVLGATVDRIPLDAQILIILLAAQVIVVYRERVNRIEMGPLVVDLDSNGITPDIHTSEGDDNEKSDTR